MGKPSNTRSPRSSRPLSAAEANGRATLLAPTSSRLFPKEALLYKALAGELEQAELSGQRRLHLETIARAISTHAIRLVGQEGALTAYVHPLDPSAPPVFSHLNSLQLASFLHSHAPTFITGGEATQISQTLMVELNKPEHKLVSKFLSRRIIAISSTLFWDSHTATLHEQIPPRPCYIRLFDSSSTQGDESIGKIPTFTEAQIDEAFSGTEFLDTYNSVLDHLEQLPDHIFPATPEEDTIPHSPLLTFMEDWANGSTGFYWDLFKMAAANFMTPKPEAAFFLTGVGANGKSAYVNLLKALLGIDNVAGVPVSKLSDWHYSSRLQYVLLNAPDDEDKNKRGGSSMLEHSSDFKSIAAHETYDIPIMFSQTTAHLNADFMCIFPMNHKPDWSRQDDAAALMRRTIDFPFTGVFDTPYYKAKYRDFYKECYTLPALRDFLAYALAIATFYTRHRLPIAWSPTVAMATERLAEKNNSAKTYKSLFSKFFDGYQTMQLLYFDYVLFCKMADIVPAERAQFEMLWTEYENVPAKNLPIVSIKLDDGSRTTAKCRRLVNKPNYQELLAKLPLSALNIKDSSAYYQATDIASLHEHEMSIVYILNALKELKEGRRDAKPTGQKPTGQNPDGQNTANQVELQF